MAVARPNKKTRPCKNPDFIGLKPMRSFDTEGMARPLENCFFDHKTILAWEVNWIWVYVLAMGMGQIEP